MPQENKVTSLAEYKVSQFRAKIRSACLGLSVILALFSLWSCQTMVNQDLSNDQKIAAAVIANTTVLQLTLTLLNGHHINKDEAKGVLLMSDKVEVAITTARAAIIHNDPNTATVQIALAQQILTQLQAYLASKQPKV